MKKQATIVVLKHENTGARLCQDGLFRNFANFGTFPDCVKVYRIEGAARRKQLELLDKACPCEMIFLHHGWSMDACGRVSREND